MTTAGFGNAAPKSPVAPVAAALNSTQAELTDNLRTLTAVIVTLAQRADSAIRTLS